MKKLLFIDTETTGLPIDWKAPVERLNNWPRLVQIAWVTCELSGKIISEKEFIVKPDNYTIPEEAIRIHKISNEIAQRKGIPLENILTQLNTEIESSDYVVAHNISFDEKIIGAEFLRKSIKTILSSKKKICTMTESTIFCAIPGNYGYKWPNLTELHYKLFATKQAENHNALIDIQTTFKCFWKLKELGIINIGGQIKKAETKLVKEFDTLTKEKINIIPVIEKNNQPYLEIWNSLGTEWKEIIIKKLPQISNPDYIDFMFSGKAGALSIPSFEQESILTNDNLITLRNTLGSIKSITLDNSKGSGETKYNSIAPLIYFSNLEHLTIKDYLHLKEKKQITDISPISKLTKLKSLSIDCSPIRDLEALRGLTQLESLEFNHTQVSSLEPISKLLNLKKLKFTCSKAQSVSAIKELTLLEELEFGCSESTICDISWISNLRNLKHLSITHNPIYDISALKELKKLESLFLSWTPISDISPISELSKLSVVWLHETKIKTLEPLRNLKELVRIDFDKTLIDNIEPILNLPKVEMISCEDTRLSIEQVEKLKSRYPNASIKAKTNKKNAGCMTIVLIFVIALICMTI